MFVLNKLYVIPLEQIFSLNNNQHLLKDFFINFDLFIYFLIDFMIFFHFSLLVN